MLGGLSGAKVVGGAVVGGSVDGVIEGVVVGGEVSRGASEIHRENIIKMDINAHIFINDVEIKKIKMFCHETEQRVTSLFKTR